jgi:hypothetical protein
MKFVDAGHVGGHAAEHQEDKTAAPLASLMPVWVGVGCEIEGHAHGTYPTMSLPQEPDQLPLNSQETSTA